MLVLATVLLLTLSGCGVNLLDLDGAQRDKLWDASQFSGSGFNVDNIRTAQREWGDDAGIDDRTAIFFIQSRVTDPKLVEQWGQVLYSEQNPSNNMNDKRAVAKVISEKADDILSFIKEGITPQQHKEIVTVLNKASESVQGLNSDRNITLVWNYMNSNNVSAQEAYDKLAARGFYKPVEISPQKAQEIRHILQVSSYNTQQRLRPHLDESIVEVATCMDKYNLSAQDAINKVIADSDQKILQSSLKEWGPAAAKKCHNKIYDLQDTWTSTEKFDTGACYTVNANIFQSISSNRVLSKIIVYSAYQFKLIYIAGSKPIRNGELLLLTPAKYFRYRNVIGDTKEINGFRVIQ